LEPVGAPAKRAAELGSAVWGLPPGACVVVQAVPSDPGECARAATTPSTASRRRHRTCVDGHADPQVLDSHIAPGARVPT
jgi:hypothetical protein